MDKIQNDEKQVNIAVIIASSVWALAAGIVVEEVLTAILPIPKGIPHKILFGLGVGGIGALVSGMVFDDKINHYEKIGEMISTTKGLLNAGDSNYIQLTIEEEATN